MQNKDTVVCFHSLVSHSVSGLLKTVDKQGSENHTSYCSEHSDGHMKLGVSLLILAIKYLANDIESCH